MRAAYADPPYPGNAHLYRDHPDYAGEVDHEALLARLDGEYATGLAKWTEDAAEAFRFSSRAAAETEIDRRSGFPIPSHGGPFGIATEHLFAAQEAPALDGLRAALDRHQPAIRGNDDRPDIECECGDQRGAETFTDHLVRVLAASPSPAEPPRPPNGWNAHPATTALPTDDDPEAGMPYRVLGAEARPPEGLDRLIAAAIAVAADYPPSPQRGGTPRSNHIGALQVAAARLSVGGATKPQGGER